MGIGVRVGQAVALLKESAQGNVHLFGTAKSLSNAVFSGRQRRFIVFLVIGYNAINGGWMSIFSIAKESRRFSDIHGAEIAMCTALGHPPLRRFTKFDNTGELFPFALFLRDVPENSEVLVHVPECYIEKYILRHHKAFRRASVRWRFNILLQNIDCAPSRDVVSELKKLGAVTATAAHAAYATDETAAQLDCPVRFLSTWVCPEEFIRTGFADKDDLIVVSPDQHPLKRRVLSEILSVFPTHDIVEIKNMTYREYRAVIQRAKFSLTFGEGLDGYFVEPIFCGGIGMAMFNDRFFSTDYGDLPGVISAPESNPGCISAFMAGVNNARTYTEIAERQFARLPKQYVRDEYLANLRSFYKAHFASDVPQRLTRCASGEDLTVATEN